MAIYTDRIVLVFPIAAKNRPAAASLQTLEITESGQEFEKLVPLDPKKVSDYADEFSLPLIAELAEVRAELEATTQAKTTLETQVATLTDQLNLANNTLEAVEKTAMELGAKVTELEQYRPYNPNLINAAKFYDRIDKDDMVSLLASENPVLVSIGKAITLYRDNADKWPVVLNSPETQGMLEAVLQSGIFDANEVLAIARPATREEAYA